MDRTIVHICQIMLLKCVDKFFQVFFFGVGGGGLLDLKENLSFPFLGLILRVDKIKMYNCSS